MDEKALQREAEESLAVFGSRMREIRRRGRLSIREVASRAQVDKNTVLAMEKGRPVRESSRSRICAVLGVLPVIPTPSESEPAPFRVHPRTKDRWVRLVLPSPREPSLISESDTIQLETVRLRLGRNGLASQFMRRLECARPGGTMKAAVFEVFGSSGWGRQASGEGLLYVIKGQLRFAIEGQSVILGEGEAVMFDRTIAHLHEPGPDVSEAELPTRVLYVQTD